MQQTPDGKIVWTHVTAADFQAVGAKDADTEGIVSYVRGVRGADAGILFREMADGQIRVSLRSREGLDVSQIAARFGGGGHRMASGCTLPGPLAQAEQTVLAAVLASLKNTPTAFLYLRAAARLGVRCLCRAA